MTDMLTTVATDVTKFLNVVEKTAVKDWNLFLNEITYLRREAGMLGAWVQAADPALGAQVQSFIKVAEASAAALAAKEGTALQNFTSAAVDAAEQRSATAIQGLSGNSPLGVAASALETSAVAEVGNVLSHAANVGFAKAVAGLLSAAGVKPVA